MGADEIKIVIKEEQLYRQARDLSNKFESNEGRSQTYF